MRRVLTSLGVGGGSVKSITTITSEKTMRKCLSPKGCPSTEKNRVPVMYPNGRTAEGLPKWYTCQDCGYHLLWDGPEGRALREQGRAELSSGGKRLLGLLFPSRLVRN